jgi:hypothetical protein
MSGFPFFKMKKFLTSIIAVFYLFTSLGATLHFHYCMGRIVSWSLVSHESSNCHYCGMPNEMAKKEGQLSQSKCCKDEQKELKTGGDQKMVQLEFQFLKYGSGQPPDKNFAFLLYPDIFAGYVLPPTHAPPFLKRQAFLMHRNFRI